MTQTILHIKDLVIGYGKTHLCSAINTDAKRGEIIGIIGRNGTGKSTLLHTISGYTKSIQGTILLKGNDLGSLSHKEKAKAISIVSTASNVKCGLSVYEILATAFYLETNWMNQLSEEQEEKLYFISNLFSITHLHHKKSYEISDGERQRVIIASAYARDTSVLLLDEPTAYLDIPNKIKIFKLLKDIAHRGKIVIFTTHDIHFAWENMDRCWLLNNNKKELEELSAPLSHPTNFHRDFNDFIINKLQ